MKKIVITMLAFSLGFAFALKGQLKTTGSWTYEDLDDFIVQLMTDSHIPGLSACIILGDSVVWNNNYGYMNLANNTPVHDSTLFNVFSIGKAITAASIMQLWDQQVLGLSRGTGLYGDRITWGHNGGSTGGYAAHMQFYEEENSGVLITFNLEQYSPLLVMKLFDFAARIVIPLETTLHREPLTIAG